MAIDWERRGVAVARVCIGVFFVSEGASKISWFASPAPLAQLFAEWLRSASWLSAFYLQNVAIPGVSVFARLVPMAEVTCGAMLLAGYRIRAFALLALLMVLNFHVASGALFRPAFLTDGYGLPVVGALLGLAFGRGRGSTRTVSNGR